MYFFLLFAVILPTVLTGCSSPGSATGCSSWTPPAGPCGTCWGTFTLNNAGQCWPDNCAVCSIDEGVCTLCNGGYYAYNGKCYNPCPAKTVISGTDCVDCGLNCDICSDVSTCTTCSSGFKLYNGQCYSSCPTTTFPFGAICLDCPSNCDTCGDSSVCTTCSSGYHLYNYACYSPCPIKTYSLGSICAGCGSNCDSCSDATMCTTCSPGWKLYNGQCINTCPVATFASGVICQDCGANCDACSDAATCTGCSSGWKLYNGQCYNTCPVGTFPIGTNCQSCPANCDICGDSTFCSTCSSGFYSHYGACYNPCPATTFISGSVCAACGSNCDTCSDATICTACSSGWKLYNGQCYNPCPTKTFTSGSICAACPSNCDTCSDGVTCTVCSSDWKLYNGQCYNPCPVTTYAVGVTCQNCGSNCDTCSDAATCTGCSSGWKLYLGQCYNPCPVTTFTSGSICAACPSNCDTCSDGVTCTVCSSGWRLYLGQCYNPCPVTTVPYGSICKNCPSNCDVCSDENTCTTCSSFYYLYQHQCLSSCPVTTYTLGTSCLDCSSYCDTCVDSNTCTFCSSGYYFYQSKCYKKCPLKAPYLSPTVAPYVCFETCPIATPYSYQNLCYAACPAEAPYLIDGVCNEKSLIAELSELGNSAASTASTILIGRSIASFSNPSLFLFGSLMKLLEYTRYMNISHSDGLEILFQTISDSSDLIPMPSMSPEMQNALETHPMPDVFERYDYSSNFLLNVGNDILGLLTILSLFVICWLGQKGVGYLRNIKTLRSLMKNSRFFFQNFIIGKFYEILGDVALASVFEIKTFSSSDRYSWLSIWACISCLTLGAILYLINFWLIYAHQKKKGRALKRFCELFKGAEILFDSFSDESFLHQAAMIFFVARNILTGLVIAIFTAMPLFQSAILLVLSFFMVVYYLLLRPMKSQLEFVEQISFEILLLAVNGCFFVQAMCDTMQASSKPVVNFIGQMIIILNTAFKFLPLIFLAVQVGLVGKKYYKLIKHALDSEEAAAERNKTGLNSVLGSYKLSQASNDTSFIELNNPTLEESVIVSRVRLDVLRNRRAKKLFLAEEEPKNRISKPRSHVSKFSSSSSKKNVNPSIALMKHLADQREASSKAARIRRKDKGVEIRKRVQKEKIFEEDL